MARPPAALRAARAARRARVTMVRRAPRVPESLRCAASVALAVVLLNVALTFDNVWPTFLVAPTPALSVELAVLVAGLAAAGALGRLPSVRGVAALAALVTLLAAARYASVTTAALYGRPVHLYFDLPHVPNVLAMLAKVADPPLLALGAVAVAAALVAVFVVLRKATAVLVDGLRRPMPRMAVGTAAGAVVAAFVLGGDGIRGTFASPASAALWTQAAQWADASRAARHDALLPPGEALAFGGGDVAGLGNDLARPGNDLAGPGNGLAASGDDLAGLGGADVVVVFVESYGAVAFDRGNVAAGVADARAKLARSIDRTGRAVVSAFVESPTFAGASWLAHASFLTGARIDNGGAYDALLGSDRDTLARRFRRAGYRAAALMPGLREPWPEGAFYGFDAIHDASALDWQGPAFGWWRIPDQYALARFDTLERAAGRPLFALFATVSTHVPFRPTPPYQPHWDRLAGERPFDADDLARQLAGRPDWLDLTPAYVESLGYAYRVLGGWLERRADDDLVLIVLGDHQPAASVAGRGARWDVPVHVVGPPRLVAALERAGFVPGLEPAPASVAPMHRLAPMLLDAFGRSGKREPVDAVQKNEGRP